MAQVCIMNTIPELAVSSCNTVCNSRITCIQCVPPFRLKRNSGYKKKRKESIADICDNLEGQQVVTENTGSIVGSRSRLIIQQLSEQLNANLEPESLIDFDSSDEDEVDSQSGNEDKEKEKEKDKEKEKEKEKKTTQQGSPTPSSNNTLTQVNSGGSIGSIFGTNSIHDVKHSTMWIGNDDGSLHVFQFSDSTIRTVARKNRITKQFSSGIQSLLYMDNKVYLSLDN